MRVAVLFVLVLAGLAGASPAAAAKPRDAAPGAAPNIIMVRTDDQSLASFRPEYMPEVFRFFERRGTFFTNSVVSTPQCCPSRAGAMTGQYAHNNGVPGNRPGYAGLVTKRNVLPSWLRRAGYRTIHIGKWLHGYSERYRLRSAPGWDRWFTMNRTLYFDAYFSVDGEGRAFPNRHLGSVLGNFTERMIRRYAPRRKPFYLQLDEFAPHASPSETSDPRCGGAAIPAPADAELFTDVPAPRDPAYDEPDVTDKPEYMQRRPAFTAPTVENIDRSFGCSLAALQTVDRRFGKMIKLLQRKRELRNTVLVFTSDNGYSLGGHRLPLGKGLPYEDNLRVPLAISTPKRGFRGRPSSSPATVANIDLAATTIDLAGGKPCLALGDCRRLDGRSLVPLLRGKEREWSEDRRIVTSLEIGLSQYPLSCAWEGYWSPLESVTLHTRLPDADRQCGPAEEWEAYDLGDDPFQLEARDATAEERAGLKALRSCSGIQGRDRRLAGVPFCE